MYFSAVPRLLSRKARFVMSIARFFSALHSLILSASTLRASGNVFSHSMSDRRGRLSRHPLSRSKKKSSNSASSCRSLLFSIFFSRDAEIDRAERYVIRHHTVQRVLDLLIGAFIERTQFVEWFTQSLDLLWGQLVHPSIFSERTSKKVGGQNFAPLRCLFPPTGKRLLELERGFLEHLLLPYVVTTICIPPARFIFRGMPLRLRFVLRFFMSCAILFRVPALCFL